MTDLQVRQTLPAAVAWRNVVLMAALLWLVVGIGGLNLAAVAVARRFGPTVEGAFVLDLVFGVGAAIIIAAVVATQRRRGETIRDLGWGRPTRPVALVVAVVFGALWAAASYARGGDPLALTWQRPIMMLVGVVLAFGEELAVRGYMMEQLRRARVPAWLQVVATALVMASYHGLIGWSYSIPYAISSFVLFGIVSLIFLLGRRSLTPVVVAHALAHVLGDPVLTQGILFGVLAG